MTNQLLSMLVNFVSFRPPVQTPEYLKSAGGGARQLIRPSNRSGVGRAGGRASTKDMFRAQDYSSALRDKMLRETELYLTAGLQSDRGEPNCGEFIDAPLH